MEGGEEWGRDGGGRGRHLGGDSGRKYVWNADRFLNENEKQRSFLSPSA